MLLYSLASPDLDAPQSVLDIGTGPEDVVVCMASLALPINTHASTRKGKKSAFLLLVGIATAEGVQLQLRLNGSLLVGTILLDANESLPTDCLHFALTLHGDHSPRLEFATVCGPLTRIKHVSLQALFSSLELYELLALQKQQLDAAAGQLEEACAAFLQDSTTFQSSCIDGLGKRLDAAFMEHSTKPDAVQWKRLALMGDATNDLLVTLAPHRKQFGTLLKSVTTLQTKILGALAAINTHLGTVWESCHHYQTTLTLLSYENGLVELQDAAWSQCKESLKTWHGSIKEMALFLRRLFHGMASFLTYILDGTLVVEQAQNAEQPDESATMLEPPPLDVHRGIMHDWFLYQDLQITVKIQEAQGVLGELVGQLLRIVGLYPCIGQISHRELEYPIIASHSHQANCYVIGRIGADQVWIGSNVGSEIEQEWKITCDGEIMAVSFSDTVMVLLCKGLGSTVRYLVPVPLPPTEPHLELHLQDDWEFIDPDLEPHLLAVNGGKGMMAFAGHDGMSVQVFDYTVDDDAMELEA
ncbi:hypothetical protein HDV03_003232 [Kappamyces sp. JEL0829]|nr:hypothetical protein HDV03_003232 [Kappamyces sp. JEL0829]